MHKIYLLLLLFLSFVSLAYPQLDTSGGRYCQPVFQSATKTSNVVYGSALNSNGATQTLAMDVYQPTDDTATLRGLIVFAHGGSFLAGTRTDQDVSALCDRFAKMGYVTCSIDYRLGFFPIDSVNATRAVVRAVQDMKAAIRFFRKDAVTANIYHIHPDYIFAGGSSAGAFTALHLAYMNQLAEVPAWADIASLGGLDGNSGNPGYSSKVSAVINLCGALADSSFIEPHDIPFVSMHGTNDQVVPYGTDTINLLGFFPVMIVHGSASLKSRADHVNTYNALYTWQGAPHVPYSGTSAAAIAYMDTTVEFVREFLCPLVSAPSISNTLKVVSSTPSFIVYPNPVTSTSVLQFSRQFENARISIYDVLGKEVMSKAFSGSKTNIEKGNLASGIYFVKVFTNEAQQLKKIVVE